MIPGYDLPSSVKALEIAEKYNLFASCGLHPHDAKKFTRELLREIEQIASSSKKVVAIGEIGLDFFKNYSPPDIQIKVFREFLELAKSLKKPVILHIRDAYKEVFDLLERHNLPSVILHCFSGTPEDAKYAVKRGYYVSFSGTITYKNEKLIKSLEVMPMEKLLVETDAPYLTPSIEKGRNEPSYIVHTVNKIASILNTDPEEVAELTFQNTLNAFLLDS